MKYLLSSVCTLVFIAFLTLNAVAQSESIKEEIIHFHSLDSTVTLGGTITTPINQPVRNAAVILSVAGPTDRDGTVGPNQLFKSLAHSLAKEGIATIRFDDRGVGESSGDLMRTTLTDRAGDACKALKKLENYLELTGIEAGFIGMSEGGGVGLLAGSYCGPIDFAILLSTPVRKGEEVMKSQMDRMISMSPLPDEKKNKVKEELNLFLQLAMNPTSEENQNQIRNILSSPLGKMILPPYRFVPESTEGQVEFVLSPWYQSQLHYDVQEVISASDYPLLALYGELDKAIDPKANANLLKELNPNASVEMMKGLNHLMQEAKTGLPSEYASLPGAVSNDATTHIINWLQEIGSSKD